MSYSYNYSYLPSSQCHPCYNSRPRPLIRTWSPPGSPAENLPYRRRTPLLRNPHLQCGPPRTHNPLKMRRSPQPPSHPYVRVLPQPFSKFRPQINPSLLSPSPLPCGSASANQLKAPMEKSTNDAPASASATVIIKQEVIIEKSSEQVVSGDHSVEVGKAAAAAAAAAVAPVDRIIPEDAEINNESGIAVLSVHTVGEVEKSVDRTEKDEVDSIQLQIGDSDVESSEIQLHSQGSSMESSRIRRDNAAESSQIQSQVISETKAASEDTKTETATNEIQIVQELQPDDVDPTVTVVDITIDEENDKLVATKSASVSPSASTSSSSLSVSSALASSALASTEQLEDATELVVKLSKSPVESPSKETTGLLGSVMKTDLGEILRRSSRERKTNTRFIKDSIVPGMKLTDMKVGKTKQSSSLPTLATITLDSGSARTNVITRKDPKLKGATSPTLDGDSSSVAVVNSFMAAAIPITAADRSIKTEQEATAIVIDTVIPDDQLKKDAIEGGKRLVIKARKTFAAVAESGASELASSSVEVRPPTYIYDTLGNLTGKMTLPKKRFAYKVGEKRQKKRFFKGSTYHMSLHRAQHRKKKNTSSQEDDDASDATSSGIVDDSYVDVNAETEQDNPKDAGGGGDDDDDEEGLLDDVPEPLAASSVTDVLPNSEDNTSTSPSQILNDWTLPDDHPPPSAEEIVLSESECGDAKQTAAAADDEKMIVDNESEIDEVEVELPCENDDQSGVQQQPKTSEHHSFELEMPLTGNQMTSCAIAPSGMKRKQATDDATALPSNTTGDSCSPNKKAMSPGGAGKQSLLGQPLRIPIIHNGDIIKRVPHTVTLHQSVPVYCTCRSLEGTHVTQEPTKGHFCQGIDCIDNRLIGCVNAVCLQELLRPAARVPFQALCEVHRQRLKLHQCCPGCGLFCSQGTFIQCRADPRKSIHHSHKDCLLIKNGKELCPHCGDGSNLQDVSLELNAPRPPSFFHKQQPVRKEPGARMAFTKGTEGAQRSDAPESPTFRSYMIDQSGTEITSAGLPMGPDRSQLEGVLHNLSKQKPSNLRYSIKHMYTAAKNGEVEKILHMLVMGLDPNTKFEEQDNCTPLHLAAASGHLALVHVLVQASAFLDALDDTLQTPLIYAIENGQGKICEYLIKAGAQLEARAEDGMTALHLAAKAGQLEVVKQILDTGKVNINIQDDGGWTPLVWAAEHRHLVVVKYLLKRGSDPNIRDNERNIALHWSSFSGSLEISETFLNHGCDLNSANEHGDTPLHIAARQDKYECVMLLLARSADVDAQNKEGETPPMCCPDTTTQTWLALSMTKHLKKISVSRTLRTERILHQDISRGKEQSPIQCINGVDDELAPADYLYIVENCETAPVNVERSISTLQSCRCEDDCTSLNCQCSAMSLKCWFDKDGKLMDSFNLFDPPMIFECNRACLCWATCHNRVLQRGITCRLQLFRTKGKGWGVRALKDIPRGTFICEYVGELISDLEADQREDDSYLFDLDNRDGETYCIDARRYGNISRFINHLCEPNLVPVKVFIEYQDLRFPRIALFSSRNIRAYEELGFDYGDKFWVIKYKMFTCTCASEKCKYSTKTIHSTLANYDKRLREEQEENAAAAEN